MGGYVAPARLHSDSEAMADGGALRAGQTCAGAIFPDDTARHRRSAGRTCANLARCCMLSMIDTAMPVTHVTPEHREKPPEIDPPESFYACTARDVRKAE